MVQFRAGFTLGTLQQDKVVPAVQLWGHKT